MPVWLSVGLYMLGGLVAEGLLVWLVVDRKYRKKANRPPKTVRWPPPGI